MAFAIAGASGTGKTTLARAIAGELAIPYRDMSFGRIARERGYPSAVADMTINARMDMQFACLAAYEIELSTWEGPFVTDRSPIDMIGYVLAEVGMHANTHPTMAARIVTYVRACVDATREAIAAILVARPLGMYETSPHRPGEDAAYQTHVQLLIEGGLAQLDGSLPTIALPKADVDTRVAAALPLLREVGARRGYW